jgi:hypothetical protein
MAATELASTPFWVDSTHPLSNILDHACIHFHILRFQPIRFKPIPFCPPKSARHLLIHGDTMRQLIYASLFCLLAWSGGSQANPALKEKTFTTEAEGSACMGDDKSRKQTEEVARNEAKRRAAEQAATQVRAQSRVSIGTLEEDVIKIIATGKVRVLDVLSSTWDKEGCYKYRIRAEVTQSRPGEMQGGLVSEEERRWAELEDAPDLRTLDTFLAQFPHSVNSEKAYALQAELEASYPRVSGPFLVYRETTLYLRPSTQAVGISQVAPGDILRVAKIHDAEWAAVKRDTGELFTPFRHLRPISDDEDSAWIRCKKAGKDVQAWRSFLQNYPKSHLARLASVQLTNIENRLAQETGMSARDSEEIALWNRCLNTRDLQCAREYRRRFPNGKFEKESWQIR